MHGIIGRSIDTALPSDEGDDWKPYIPGIFRWREVVRQLGHKPVLYVMRKHDGKRWLYRACTPKELSDIEWAAVNHR